MNIFALDDNPKLAAKYHVDRHVVKMIIEYSQLLATAHRVLDGGPGKLKIYDKKTDKDAIRTFDDHVLKEEGEFGRNFISDPIIPLATHINHPCAIWVRNNDQNYYWLLNLYVELSKEYTYRYGKDHKSARHIKFLSQAPVNIRHMLRRNSFCMAMPDNYKEYYSHPVLSYRSYLKYEKSSVLHKWKNRSVPKWWDEI